MLPTKKDPKRCAKCQQKFSKSTGMAIDACGHKWHAECLVCNHCGKDFKKDDFVCATSKIDGLVYHHECHTQRFHPTCFVCGELVPQE